MNEKEYSDKDLEEEIDKALEISEKKLNVFRIIKNEKDALDRKDNKMKAKIKPVKKIDDE